jgi:hypothetical protein
MMASVLEHLDVKPRQIIAASAGIYCTLYMLAYCPEVFATGLNPPPWVYLMAPWSPLLPASHPDYYSSPLAWIPPKIIETQHLTVRPQGRYTPNGAGTDERSYLHYPPRRSPRRPLWS